MLQELLKLVSVCDDDERELIEKMICAAGDYARAVVIHRTRAMNVAGVGGEELRNRVTAADRDRTSAHNVLIDSVNIVNRLCAFHNMAPIYTGGNARREYGDFAIALTDEVFADR